MPAARPLSRSAHAVALALLLLAVGLLVAPAAFWLQGFMGVTATALAAAICAAGGVGGILAVGLFGADEHSVGGVLAPMFVRMAVPLGCALVIFWSRGPLFEAGLLVYLIGFYLVALAADTWLAVVRTGAAGEPSREL